MLDLLDLIDAELGPGIATPDHVLTAAQHLHPCSATEPEPVYPDGGTLPRGLPGRRRRGADLQADTGLVTGAAHTFPWLAGVDGDPDPRNSNGTILPYGGHGTFVAGVLRCMAPQAQVRVANVFDTAGSATESEVAMRLNAAFGFGFEILHITASCLTRKNIPPLALEAFLELLRPYKGVVCVAEAGNNYTRRPSWPGAFPDVLSVGALATDWRHRADFSNYGGWVDVYAPGEKLINAIGSGTYTYQIPPIPRDQAGDVLRPGAMERDFILGPHRDRADRGPDGPLWRERPGSGRGPAGQGAGPDDSGCGPCSAPQLRRWRLRALQGRAPRLRMSPPLRA